MHKFILSALLFFAFIGTSFAAVVSDLRFFHYPNNKVRIVMEMDSTVKFNKFTLSDPPRLVFDFPNSSHRVRNLQIDKGSVIGVRAGYRNEQTLRFVIDLNSNAKTEIFQLAPDNDNRHHRVVIDIFDGGLTAPMLSLTSLEESQSRTQTVKNKPQTIAPIAANKQQSGVVKNKKPEPTRQTTTTASNGKIQSAKKSGKTVVCIDAGHGGTDHGAHNPVTGLKEKNVVFAIAAITRQELIKRGYQVYLTRPSDNKIEVNTRPKLCRQAGGDIFVSIHADSVASNDGIGGPRGSSVYILNMRGANKQLDSYLNRRANASSLQWDLNVYGYNRNTQAAILAMQMEATSEASMILAKQTLAELAKIGKLAKNNVKYENFGVLRGATEFPAILVETGFISNLEEAKLLSTPTHQQKLARAIANGIDAYFKLHTQQHNLLKN
ncbi:MAG: N-acetylmuramoyl-L-alanine amidase [Cardiobacteriaceae bacterium]|nr:N-acetylmuramoyl-L-alanine amidase [Cardiobacteriaceae bacterium]